MVYIKCNFCGQEIKKGNWHHYKNCEKYNEFISKNQKDIVEQYNKGFSILDISQKYCVGYRIIQNILINNNINIRGLKECSTQCTKEKYKKTMIENWGCEHNFEKNCESRKNWEKKIYEEEGITNVFQRKSVIDKIKKKLNEKYTKDELYFNYAKGSTLKYWIEKLGEEEGLKVYQNICENKGKSGRLSYFIEKYGEEIGKKKFEERIKKVLKSSSIYSSLNKRFKLLLEKNGINFVQEKIISYTDEYGKNRYFSYDFLINNTLFELNGDFWHANPKKYKKNDLVNFPSKQVLVENLWKHDEIKKQVALSNNYKLVVIWESEMKNLTDEELLNLIKSNV